MAGGQQVLFGHRYDPVNGSDATGNGTIDKPYKTLAKCKQVDWDCGKKARVKKDDGSWYVESKCTASGDVNFSLVPHYVDGVLKGYKYDDISGDGVNP